MPHQTAPCRSFPSLMLAPPCRRWCYYCDPDPLLVVLPCLHSISPCPTLLVCDWCCHGYCYCSPVDCGCCVFVVVCGWRWCRWIAFPSPVLAHVVVVVGVLLPLLVSDTLSAVVVAVTSFISLESTRPSLAPSFDLVFNIVPFDFELRLIIGIWAIDINCMILLVIVQFTLSC